VSGLVSGPFRRMVHSSRLLLVEKQGYEQDDEGEAAEIGQHAEARPDFTVEDQRPSPEIIDI